MTEKSKVPVKERLDEISTVSSSLLQQFFPPQSSEFVKGDIRQILKVKPWHPHCLQTIPSRVLTEDDYIDILERIIQRDFFPDLPLLWACEQLEKAKVRGEHPHKIKRLQQTVEDIYAARQEKTVPPMVHQVALQDGRELKIDISKLGLKEFQSLFTSEDNASFEKLVGKEKMKLALQQMWIEKNAISYNHDNLQVSAALSQGERPASLLYNHFAPRNPLLLPISKDSVGVMGLFSQEKSSDLIQFTLPSPKRNNTQEDKTEIITANTRLLNEESFLDSMYRKQLLKQKVAQKNEAETALFDEMVEKGIYSANALVEIHVMESLMRNNKRPNSLSLEEMSQIECLKGGLMTPDHKGYAFLRTPLTTHDTSQRDCSGSTPQRRDTKFTIPYPSSRELTARMLCDRATRRVAAEKLNKKSNCIREVLKATNTPIGRTMTPLNMFYKGQESSLTSLRQTHTYHHKKLRSTTLASNSHLRTT